MTEPTPYVPEEGWNFYLVDVVPDDWQVKAAPNARTILTGKEVRRTWSADGLVLARPPEPELIAVMLPATFVNAYAYEGALGGSDIVRAACRAALAASPVSEREQP